MVKDLLGKIQRLPRRVYRFQTRNRSLDDVNKKIVSTPARTPGIAHYENFVIHYADARNLREMLQLQIVEGYNDFKSDKNSPYIIDCGSNIGISVLKFKMLYPSARILAFEPDKNLFQMLCDNLVQNKLENVEAVEAAVWVENTEIPFYEEGTDAGRVVSSDSAEKNVRMVRAIDLQGYLTEEVDLLKIDIEGVEDVVLEKCAPSLHFVKNIIVETHYRFENSAKLIQVLKVLNDAGFNVSICTSKYYNLPQLQQRSSKDILYHLIPVITGWRD